MDILTTGVMDLDWKIFDKLSDADILHLCQVNKKMNAIICDNDEFWRHRATQRFTYKKKTPWKHYYQKSIDISSWYYYEKIDKPKNSYKIPISYIYSGGDTTRSMRVGDIVAIQDDRSDTSSWKFIVTSIDEGIVTINYIDAIDDKLKFPKETLDIVSKIGIEKYIDVFKPTVQPISIYFGTNHLYTYKNNQVYPKK